jgi:hypothetical protein
MINPRKGIDLMNNTSIINRILFAVTIFQYSPLEGYSTTSSGERERATTLTTSGTPTGISINHQIFFSSSSFTA